MSACGGLQSARHLLMSYIGLRSHLTQLDGEPIPVIEAAGRVLVRSVTSQLDIPGFPRAMMDGFAVQSRDTSGASPYSPVPVAVVGESLPGQPTATHVAAGQAVRIMTGAPVPDGADGVLPVEQVRMKGEQVWALSEIPPGKHVAFVGEDIAAGQQVLAAGRRLRPQDVGVLASIGVAEVEVVRKVRVRIIVTGNELLAPGSRPQGIQIVDSNSPMLAAFVRRDGGSVSNPGIVPDDPAAIRQAMRDDADVILVSGGSSVGQEDHAPRLLAEEGELAIHGISMRPSSPTGMGRLGPRWVFLLPGNPVSCLCAYDFFAGPAIRTLGGLDWDWPYRSCRLRLRRKLVSAIGRVDYARVQIVDGEIEPLAISGASMLSSTTRADGFVVIPQDREGYAEGTEIEMFLYDM